MDIFRYEPIDLDGPSFRLLRLLKGEGPNIECELFQAWLHGDYAMCYEALSYTWGVTEMSATVTINRRIFYITENLYIALQNLRSQETDRILWVDAICIDQGNTRERGHQVQQMGDIYTLADKVTFWLGPATYEINVLMDSLGRLEEESLQHACRHWNLTDQRWNDLWLSVQPILMLQHSNLAALQREGLKLLLRRPWFKRVWILQEVANAKRAVVWSGNKSISARIFTLAPLLIGINPERHCQAVLDIMPGPSRKNSWWSKRRDLYNIWLRFSGSEASDPRDLIYALLGISSDAHDTDSLRPDYSKTLQQVVRDTASFLFGVPDVPCQTLSELSQRVHSLNIAPLCKIAKISDASNVAAFLTWRESEVMIAEEVVIAAAENWRSGEEVMDLLLRQRGREVRITKEVVKAAAGNQRSGQKVINLLLRQRREEVVTAAVQSGEEVITFLLRQCASEFKITEEVIITATRNQSVFKEVINLLQRRESEVNITEAIVKAAAGNQSGEEVIDLLLQQRGSEVKIIGDVVKAAAENQWGEGVMSLLLHHRGSEVKITEEVVRAAARNQSGRVMNLLLRQRRDEVVKAVVQSGEEDLITFFLWQCGSEVKIMEKVVIAAAGNQSVFEEVMNLLLRQRGSEVKITEDVVKAAAGNQWGEGIMSLLLHHRGSEVKITEDVVKAAAGNRRSGQEVMSLLLRQRGNEVKITEDVVKAAAGNWRSGQEVMSLLLRQRGNEVKITEEVLKAAARNQSRRVINLLLRQRRDEVVIAAAQSEEEDLITFLF